MEGDEGYFPVVPNSSPATIVDYEARIAHLIYNAANIPVQGSFSRPPADFVLDTGDNVYNQGSLGLNRWCCDGCGFMTATGSYCPSSSSAINITNRSWVSGCSGIVNS